MMRFQIFKKALIDSLGVFAAYVPLGMAYGYLFNQVTHVGWLAPFYSLFIFAGAIQFLALSFIGIEGATLSLVLGAAALGMRNAFYGIPLLSRFKGSKFFTSYLAFGLVDATFAILSVQKPLPEKEDKWYILYLTILIHAYWVLGTVAGVFAGKLISLPPGIEFSLTALFVVMLVDKIKSTKDFRPLWIIALSVLAASFMSHTHLFLNACCISFFLCLFLPKKEIAAKEEAVS